MPTVRSRTSLSSSRSPTFSTPPSWRNSPRSWNFAGRWNWRKKAWPRSIANFPWIRQAPTRLPSWKVPYFMQGVYMKIPRRAGDFPVFDIRFSSLGFVFESLPGQILLPLLDGRLADGLRVGGLEGLVLVGAALLVGLQAERVAEGPVGGVADRLALVLVGHRLQERLAGGLRLRLQVAQRHADLDPHAGVGIAQHAGRVDVDEPRRQLLAHGGLAGVAQQ